MKTVAVPPRFANIQDMGRALGVFLPRRQTTQQVVGSLAAIASVLGALCVLAAGAAQTYLRYYRNGPAVVGKYLLPPAVITILLLILAGLVIWSIHVRSRRGVVVYEQGLAIADRKGIQQWRWPDVESVQLAIERSILAGSLARKTTLLRLRHLNGSSVLLDQNIDRVEVLGSYIRKTIFPQLLERAQVTFLEGQPVRFGPIQIYYAEGLQIRERRYPWAEIKSVVILNGVLHVIFNDPLAERSEQIRLAEVPNVDVLLAMVEQMNVQAAE